MQTDPSVLNDGVLQSVSQIYVTFPNKRTTEEYLDNYDDNENVDDLNIDTADNHDPGNRLNFILKKGVQFCQRTKPKVIRFVKFNEANDPENVCRERLMLYHCCRNEQHDLKADFPTYQNCSADEKKTV